MEIGHGTHGKILTTEDPNVVCKVFARDCFPSETFLREIAVNKLVKDKQFVINLVPDYGQYQLRMKRYKCSLSELEGYLQLKSIIYGILHGLYQANKVGIIHQDLKPDNILIDELGDPVITDWGIASFYYDVLKNSRDLIQTLYWRAPEILDKSYESNGYRANVDIWSLGIIMLDLYTNGLIPAGKDEFHQLSLAKTIDLDLDIDPQAKDLLHRMLTIDPNRRITVDQALNHPFFDDITNCIYDPIETVITRMIPINHNLDPQLRYDVLSHLYELLKQYPDPDFSMFYLACAMLDLYTSVKFDPLTYKQIGLACLNLAVALIDMVELAYTTTNISPVEPIHVADVLETLDGELYISTLYIHLKAMEYDNIRLSQCSKLLKYVVLDYHHHRFDPIDLVRGIRSIYNPVLEAKPEIIEFLTPHIPIEKHPNVDEEKDQPPVDEIKPIDIIDHDDLPPPMPVFSTPQPKLTRAFSELLI